MHCMRPKGFGAGYGAIRETGAVTAALTEAATAPVFVVFLRRGRRGGGLVCEALIKSLCIAEETKV